MIERLPSSPEARPGKYSSARDEVLDAIAKEGWANKSDGDTGSVSGWFARISNSPAELRELMSAFEDQMNEAGLADPIELVGHFLVVEDQTGFVTVTKHEDEKSLTTDYALHEMWHQEWQNQDSPKLPDSSSIRSSLAAVDQDAASPAIADREAAEELRQAVELQAVRNQYGEAFEHWVEHMGLAQPDDTIFDFKDQYVGEFESTEAYARHYMESSGQAAALNSLLRQLPEDLRQYVKFDYEDFGDDVYNNFLVVGSNSGRSIFIYRY